MYQSMRWAVTRLSIFICVLLAAPLWSTTFAFSTSASPKGNAGQMNRKTRQHMMNSIWRHTHQKKNPREAVRLLEALLKYEHKAGTSMLKPGVVFNVLKMCQEPQSLDKYTLDALQDITRLLAINSRLYNVRMVLSVISLLVKNGRPDEAEALLSSRYCHSLNNSTQTTMAYNAVLDGFAKGANYADAERLLCRMEKEKVERNAASYTIVIKALANSRQPPRLAKELLNRMEQNGIAPTETTYNTLLRCYSNQGMVEETEDILRRLHPDTSSKENRLPQETQERILAHARSNKWRAAAPLNRPVDSVEQDVKEVLEAPVGTIVEIGKAANAIWFNIKSESDKGAETALLLLNRLLEEQQERPDVMFVKKGMVYNVLKACQQSKSSSLEKLERLYYLLRQCKLIDPKMFTQVLSAVTKCKHVDATQRAEALLDSFPGKLNNYHFGAVMNGYAKQGNAKRAEQLFARIEDLHWNGHLTEGPNRVVFNSLLNALSKSTEGNILERSEVILKKMCSGPKARPDMITYTIMFNLYSKQSAGEKAEALLEEVEDAINAGKLQGTINALTYRCVIDALARSGKPERAEGHLKRMLSKNIVVNKFHYCGVLNGYAQEGKAAEAERLLQQMHESFLQGSIFDAPNSVAYNCVMFALAKSGDYDAPFRARAHMDRMIEAKLTPDIVTYNCLLCACGNRGMANECEQILKHMHELHEAGDLDTAPNVISYNYVLDSLARSGELVWTVLRAEKLVNAMKRGGADTQPDMITYRSLLKCYANWNLPQDALRLLKRMQELHETGKLQYAPDRMSYHIVMDVLEKSDEEGTGEELDALQKEVEAMYGKEERKQENSFNMEQLDALLDYMSS